MFWPNGVKPGAYIIGSKQEADGVRGGRLAFCWLTPLSNLLEWRTTLKLSLATGIPGGPMFQFFSQRTHQPEAHEQAQIKGKMALGALDSWTLDWDLHIQNADPRFL